MYCNSAEVKGVLAMTSDDSLSIRIILYIQYIKEFSAVCVCVHCHSP